MNDFTKMLILSVIAGLALGVTSGHADVPEYVNGNQLYELCQSEHKAGSHQATRYVQGVFDTLSSLQGAFENHMICVPNDVPAGQLKDVVCNYLKDTPEERHWTALSSVAEALTDAFPCE